MYGQKCRCSRAGSAATPPGRRVPHDRASAVIATPPNRSVRNDGRFGSQSRVLHLGEIGAGLAGHGREAADERPTRSGYTPATDRIRM